MRNKSTESEAKSNQWFSTEIYFGRNIPAGGEVSEQEFAEFLSYEVTPVFPAGMTVYDAYGQMQRHSNREIVRQKTKVVVLVHKNSKADDYAITKIATAYRSKFGNPQVMLLAKPVKPVFYGD